MYRINQRLRALLFFQLSFLCATQSATILLTPLAYPSHVREMSYIGSGLKAKGHTVYAMITDTYPHLDEMRKQFDLITYPAKHPDFYSLSVADLEEIFSESAHMAPVDDMRYNLPRLKLAEGCINAIEDEDLSNRITQLKPDIAIVDAFAYSRCFYVFLHNINIPYASFTSFYEPWVWKTPALPSFVPFGYAGKFTDRMTFMERFRNAYALAVWVAFNPVYDMQDSFVQKYLKTPDPSMTYAKLHAKSLLWLFHSDWAIEMPRPLMPNEVYVGGLSTKPSKPLTGDIKKFVEGSAPHGVIVVVFGSFTQMASQYNDRFFAAFAQIKQRVVMRYYSNSADAPSNVHLVDWVPQNDLLGDNNTVLFINHGGSNSMHEALYHGVPLILLPVVADQPHNALRVSRSGCGIVLHPHSFTTEELVIAINEILTNKSYKENAMKRSKIYRDRQDTPIERAVWWIEHVIKYGGEHIHASGLDLEWYEYIMLDLLVVFVILPIVLVTMVLSCLVGYCCFRARSKAAQGKQTSNENSRKLKTN